MQKLHEDALKGRRALDFLVKVQLPHIQQESQFVINEVDLQFFTLSLAALARSRSTARQ